MTTTTSARTLTDHAGVTHPLARPFLLADAATTSGNGLVYLLAAGWLADWFGTPGALLRGLGVFLLLFGGGVALLAVRRPLPRRPLLALAAANALWVGASLAYAVAGDLTTVGTA